VTQIFNIIAPSALITDALVTLSVANPNLATNSAEYLGSAHTNGIITVATKRASIEAQKTQLDHSK